MRETVGHQVRRLLCEGVFFCFFFLVAAAVDLTIDNHFVVTRYLRDLGNAELMELGGALGLRYPHLQQMTSLKNQIVAAWLNKEDNVVTVSGPPSWANLARALRNIDQNGIANTIETSVFCTL